MNWKAVILAAILHNFFSWSFIYCCTANNDLSRLKNINSVARLDADKGLTQLIGATSLPLGHVGLKDKHSPCTLDRNNHIYSEEKGKRRRKRRIMSAVLRRMKRYPIHLDPLFQYRYLTRSGQCPTAKDGHPEFYCPTPDKHGNWRCIDDFQLCDGVRHCPNSEDELPVSCLFYRVVETHLHSVSQRLNSDDEGRQRNPR